MRTNKTKKHYRITLEYANGMTKTVDVQACSLEVAQRRALKRNPNAIVQLKRAA